tara:strand:+ start:3069 stop:3542 length:474 start_codon:yes stop_codon:yes gene_type:complete
MQIPDGFKPVPNTDCYALSPEGHVYNVKTRKRLKRFFDGYKIRTAVYDANGNQFLFAHCDIDKEPPPEVTLEYVLKDARIISDYPDYAVTYWGLVWRINPRKKGPNAGRIHVLEEHEHQGKRHVWLVHPDNSLLRKRFQTYLLTKEVWGDDCECTQD